MKTRNNVQKAILKSGAVIVSFVLISFTVNAQGFWKSLLENETFSQMAMAMSVNDSENGATSSIASNAAEATAVYSEVESEEALKVEDWMVNEAIFSSYYNIEIETEAPMAVESWMTDENLFNTPMSVAVVETEPKLEVENWMVNEKMFGSESKATAVAANKFAYEDLKESKLAIENWMVNSRNWNN